MFGWRKQQEEQLKQNQLLQGQFWKEIQIIIHQRDNYRSAIQNWLDYDGDNGDAEFTQYFTDILNNNK